MKIIDAATFSGDDGGRWARPDAGVMRTPPAFAAFRDPHAKLFGSMIHMEITTHTRKHDPVTGRTVYIDNVSGAVTIAQNGMWLPGIYADEQAAQIAFMLTYRDLRAVDASRCGFETSRYRRITVQDLAPITGGMQQ